MAVRSQIILCALYIPMHMPVRYPCIDEITVFTISFDLGVKQLNTQRKPRTITHQNGTYFWRNLFPKFIGLLALDHLLQPHPLATTLYSRSKPLWTQVQELLSSRLRSHCFLFPQNSSKSYCPSCPTLCP